MKYPKTQLLKAASSEEGRYAMHHVQFVDGKLIATNGRILAMLPVTDFEDDTEGLIPRQAIELASKGGTPSKGCRLISSENGSVRAQNKDMTLVDIARPEGEFPKYLQVIPDISDASHHVVAFNISLLHDLCLAIGAKGAVKLHIKKTKKGCTSSPILVEPIGGEDGCNASKDARGVIMPITVDE